MHKVFYECKKYFKILNTVVEVKSIFKKKKQRKEAKNGPFTNPIVVYNGTVML